MHRVEHRVDCTDTKAGLVEAEGGNATVDPAITERLNKIQSYISDGAKAFLFSEYDPGWIHCPLRYFRSGVPGNPHQLR